ncbi:sulfotransferase domain-containing protein [Thioalkalivibrio sp. ALJ3]|uniref:sulfotransferase domain-containing protein n=1 Tax=Thioalkalivibrio sp. ALJ3 TaxID=1240557 RepID=UPI0003711671|nr:sulfotransferase domain-containing protein [Thioalkalivibrio sp. ALJ3]
MAAITRKRGPARRLVQLVRRRWRRWRADVHIVSYPKCGRTWLVVLLSKALELHYGIRLRKPLRLRGYCKPWRDIPYILQHHDGGPEFQYPEELDTDKSAYARKKVVFMARDPRDVLVSSYFQKTRRNANYEGTMDDYVHERRGGIETIVDFYSIWARNRHVPEDFLLLTYEDLHADTAGELRRVLDFMGIHGVSDTVIAQAVEYGRFDNMRQLEASNAMGSSALAARDQDDSDSYKTRKGEVGGYREYLDGKSLQHVEDVIALRLDPWFERYRHQGTPAHNEANRPPTPDAAAP